MTVSTRLTPAAVDDIDALGREVRMSRGAVIAMLALWALQHQDEVPMVRMLRGGRR